MNLQTKKILGINVTTSPTEEILEEIRKYLGKAESGKREAGRKSIKPLVIFTPNPEIISYAQEDDNFARIVNTAQINLPDGVGIVWAVKKLHGIEIERIAGIDFMEKLVNLAAKQRLTIGLIGGRGDLADVTAECLLSKHKNLRIEVFEGPEIEISNIKNQISKIHIKNKKTAEEKYFENLVKDIVNRKVDILFVALGFPKQEYFIENIKYQWIRLHSPLILSESRMDQIASASWRIKYDKPLILMAVGGAFDYISGRIPRAPSVIRNMGFEWLFRLLREPWRLSRQLKGASFFWRIINS